MPNDVSYFRVDGDETVYSFDDADLTTELATEVARAKGVEGVLSNLATTVKTNLVAAINEIVSAVNTLTGRFPVSVANGGTGSTTASGALASLGAVPLVQVLGMTDNTSTTLINALNLANSNIPVGVSICYVGNNTGDSPVANRCAVICSKVNNTLGRGLVISAYSINGTVLTLSGGTWST